MNKETLIDNEFCTLWYHPDTKIIHHKFKKYVKGEPFRKMLLTATSLLKEKGATKWLSDDADMPVLSPEDQKWGETNWFPQTVQAGWKYWAIVMPKAMVNKTVMKNMANDYSKAGIIAEFFTNTNDAYTWLMNK